MSDGVFGDTLGIVAGEPRLEGPSLSLGLAVAIIRIGLAVVVGIAIAGRIIWLGGAQFLEQ